MPLGLQGKGKEVGATVAVKVSGAFILFELVPAVCGEPEPRKLVVWYCCSTMEIDERERERGITR